MFGRERDHYAIQPQCFALQFLQREPKEIREIAMCTSFLRLLNCERETHFGVISCPHFKMWCSWLLFKKEPSDFHFDYDPRNSNCAFCLCVSLQFFFSGSPLKILRTLKRVKFTDNFIITERYLFFSSLNNAPKSFLWGFYFHFRF